MEELPSTPIVTEDLTTYPEPCGGCNLVSAYGYPRLFTMVSGEEVNTWRIEFWTLGRLDQDRLHGLMDELARRMAGGLVFQLPLVPPIVVISPAEMVAYFVYERQGFGLQVPTEYCIPVPVIGQWCFSPPFAGQVVAEGYFYRLWILTRDLPMPQVAPGLESRGAAVIGFGWWAGLTLFLLAAVGAFVIVTSVVTGRDYIDQVKPYLDAFLKAPGENMGAALTMPFLALGFALVAAGIFLPMLVMKVQPTVHAGPVTVTGEVGLPGGRVTTVAPRPKKKKTA